MITKSAKTLSKSRKLSDQFFFQAENLRAFETCGGGGAQNRIKTCVSFLYYASMNNVTHKRPTPYRPHKD